MTKYTAIPRKVKDGVTRRDGGMCVICHQPGMPTAHIVRRSQGGRGIEPNIVTLCPLCHRAFDEGKDRDTYEVRIIAYIKGFYPDWSREDMIYRKGDTSC